MFGSLRIDQCVIDNATGRVARVAAVFGNQCVIQWRNPQNKGSEMSTRMSDELTLIADVLKDLYTSFSPLRFRLKTETFPLWGAAPLAIKVFTPHGKTLSGLAWRQVSTDNRSQILLGVKIDCQYEYFSSASKEMLISAVHQIKDDWTHRHFPSQTNTELSTLRVAS